MILGGGVFRLSGCDFRYEHSRLRDMLRVDGPSNPFVWHLLHGDSEYIGNFPTKQAMLDAARAACTAHPAIYGDIDHDRHRTTEI